MSLKKGPQDTSLLSTTPPDRWRDDFGALQGAAARLRLMGQEFDKPEPGCQAVYNQICQEAYACDRAAQLLRAIMDPDAQAPELMHVLRRVAAVLKETR